MTRLEHIIESIRDDVRDFVGNRQGEIEKPASIKNAGPKDITFCTRSGSDAIKLLTDAACETFVVSPDVPRNQLPRPTLNLIVVDNPRLAFLRIIERCFGAARPAGIHPSAVIHPDARISETAYVGPLCYVGRASIGPRSVLWGNVFVYDNVKIGSDVTIHAGTVLGADGFGYERAPDGTMEKFPHIGGIAVENDVEIGANACIDRGTLDDTTLRRGSKIDNLVHIAHNVIVGEDAVVIAHAMVGGSTKIGPRAWVAPSACLRDQIMIGEDATIGLASVVTKNVEAGATVLGSPARPLSEQLLLLKRLKTLTEEST